MANVGLVSCVSRKRSDAVEASELYDSALFKKAREFVEKRCDKWYILSAKYGLVEPDQIIAPYEETLNTKSRAEREHWAENVWRKLRPRLHAGDRVIVLAGERYRERLVPMMEHHGCVVEVPMEGLGIGRQLQWLSQHTSQSKRERDIDQLYNCLRTLEAGVGGKRLISDCKGQQGWPKSGVYLFFEPGEYRTNEAEARIVRVGTHGVSRGSKATLWNRLRTHRGTGNACGNHRSSIFRLHVGAALAARDRSLAVASWGIGQSSDVRTRQREEHLERAVSRHIGAMSVLWLAIEDEAGPGSDRAYLERNLIGLLAGKRSPVDPPSPDWLGRFSVEERIRKSGLWNLDFLGYPYSPHFLEVLNEYVRITLDKKPSPRRPLAPHGWYNNERQGIARNQLSLFEE